MRIARRKYFTRKNYVLFSAQNLNLFENGDDHNVALNKDDCRAYASHSRNNIDWDSQSHDIDTVIAMMPRPAKNNQNVVWRKICSSGLPQTGDCQFHIPRQVLETDSRHLQWKIFSKKSEKVRQLDFFLQIYPMETKSTHNRNQTKEN